MVEFQPSKLATWVRFPSPAPSCTDKIDDSAVKPVCTGFFRVLRAKKEIKTIDAFGQFWAT